MSLSVFENKVIVDGESYAIEKRLVIKLDKMIERVTQDTPKIDNVLINEGGEGTGKTSSAILESAYIKAKTNREIHLFFKLEPMMEFAKKTENMIIIWDEPALDSLSTDQLNSLNKDMQRLFMTIRKKRHFFIINYTKFWKFPEYMVVERANGLLHLYSSGKRYGKFIYIRKKRLEALWNDFHRTRKRNYSALKSFRGDFPNFMDFEFDKLDVFVDEIPHSTLEIYEKQKDMAICSIGIKKSKKEIEIQNRLNNLRFKITLLYSRGIIKQNELAGILGVPTIRLREWAKIEPKE
jgi:hypothetical protein